LKQLRAYLVEYFEQNPLRRVQVEGSSKLPHLTFPDVKTVSAAARLSLHFAITRPGGFLFGNALYPVGKRKHTSISARRGRIQWLRNTAAIYGPYAANQARFMTFNLRAVWEALPSSDQTDFPFMLTRMDWRRYFKEVHLPGIERYLLRMPRRLGETAPEMEADGLGDHYLDTERGGRWCSKVPGWFLRNDASIQPGGARGKRARVGRGRKSFFR
jgi:hypothetical protein